MGFWSSTGTDKPNGGKWGTENFIGDNGKNAASIINGKLYVYDPSQFDMSSVAGIPDLQVASQQDIANVSDPHGPGNGEGGSDWANILKGALYVGGGAALTGALGGAAASGGGLTSGAGTGLEAAEAGGAAGGSGTYGTLTGGAVDAPWGVNPATETNALDYSADPSLTDPSNYSKEVGINGDPTIGGNGWNVNPSQFDPGVLAKLASTLGIPASSITPTLASLLTGIAGSNAASRAADAQGQSASNAIAEQRRQFDLNRADNAPFLATGTNANARLGQLLGTNPSDGSVPSSANDAGGYGSLLRRFGVNDFNNDPVAQLGLRFGMDQGVGAINARATQAGNFDSGATAKAITRFANDYGTTKAADSYNRYNNDQSNIYARLTGQSGAGQTAVGQNAASGANTTNAITDLTTGAGNARAAGIVGGANAWGNAATGVNNALNNAQSSAILRAILSKQGISLDNAWA